MFAALLIIVFQALYFIGYFSSSSKMEVKSPNQAVVYQNNMQKTMDRLKELLLSDSETQDTGEKNEFLEKDI